MTRRQDSAKEAEGKEIWKRDPAGGAGPDWLRDIVEEVVQRVLECEMDETLHAQKGERTA